jgi:hypothetical protein
MRQFKVEKIIPPLWRLVTVMSEVLHYLYSQSGVVAFSVRRLDGRNEKNVQNQKFKEK